MSSTDGEDGWCTGILFLKIDQELAVVEFVVNVASSPLQTMSVWGDVISKLSLTVMVFVAVYGPQCMKSHLYVAVIVYVHVCDVLSRISLVESAWMMLVLFSGDTVQ